MLHVGGNKKAAILQKFLKSETLILWNILYAVFRLGILKSDRKASLYDTFTFTSPFHFSNSFLVSRNQQTRAKHVAKTRTKPIFLHSCTAVLKATHNQTRKHA